MMHFFPEGTFTTPEGYELSLDREENMIVWKKAFAPTGFRFVIVKLEIPKDAAVVFTPTKCRADRAIVLGFYPCEEGGEEIGQLDITSARSMFTRSFNYDLGKLVMPDLFDPCPIRTCSNGIHFFRTFEEAREYIF